MYNFNPDKIQIGISSCLLGQEVRFDGGHKRQHFCTDELGQHVQYLPLCPEMGIGLGKPRPTLRLEEEGGEIFARNAKGLDVTDQLKDFSRNSQPVFDVISGYIVCAKSPSCGMERVKIYQPGTKFNVSNGVGIHTQELMNLHPDMPIEENGRLNDLKLRENFITRLYTYHQWLTLKHEGLTPAKLIDFHSRFKFLMLAHDQKTYYELGGLLSDLSSDFQQKADRYIHDLMQGMKNVATRKQHCNVLQHLQGYFKDYMTSAQRQELADLIENYRLGLLPLLAPMTMIKHYLNEYPNEYIQNQEYLNPHPNTLALRYGI